MGVDMDRQSKVIIGGMGALIALAALASVVGASPPAPALNYVCPIDGLEFATYDELYQHFITAHPTEPIDITWQ